jgi:NTP pyrophosphatase (non-canonical NTP hydrolase)
VLSSSDSEAEKEARMPTPCLHDLQQSLLEFARERDWEQFHSPKNLSMALAGEAGELLEHFQWLSEAQSDALPADKREAVSLEMADILIYLLRLAQRLDVDLVDAAYRKMSVNRERYPADRVRGDARRADEYD